QIVQSATIHFTKCMEGSLTRDSLSSDPIKKRIENSCAPIPLISERLGWPLQLNHKFSFGLCLPALKERQKFGLNRQHHKAFIRLGFKPFGWHDPQGCVGKIKALPFEQIRFLSP